MQLKHSILANSLANGILYNITISVTDIKGIMSEYSNSVLFYCYAAPNFTINIAENQIIQNSSFQVNLTYNQEEGEELQHYQINLYNTNKSQIWSTGTKYDGNLTAIIQGLDDNGSYYIRAIGTTINGMNLDTDYIPFSVNYIIPNMYAIVTLENMKREGSVKIQSNIVTLEGRYLGDTENPTYIEDSYIDLSASGDRVYFDKGFSLDKNFTLNVKGYNFSNYINIIHLSNGEKTISLQKKRGTYLSEGNIEKEFLELIVPCTSFAHYVIQSNFIETPSQNDILSIWIKKINNVYDLHVVNLGEGGGI